MEEFSLRLFEFVGNHPLNVVAFGIALGLWGFYESKQLGRSVSPSQLVTEVNSNNALVVDLRSDKDFLTGHIAAAVNIPFDRLKEVPEKIKQYKDRSVIFVCDNGRHSTTAQALMKKEGMPAIRLTGGLIEWRNANMPLIKGGKRK